MAGTQLPLGRFFDGKKANSEMYDWENRQRATVARAAVALPYPSLPLPFMLLQQQQQQQQRPWPNRMPGMQKGMFEPLRLSE